MEMESQDFDENMYPIASRKARFAEEKVIGKEPWEYRQIYAPTLNGFCEEIEVFNMTSDRNFVQRNECTHIIQYKLGYRPILDSLNDAFYDASWEVLRDNISSLMEACKCTSWRFSDNGTEGCQGEDLTIAEIHRNEYPKWCLYFALASKTTYGEVISNANKLEEYFRSLRNKIEERVQNE
jgi:hypothetical protein